MATKPITEKDTLEALEEDDEFEEFEDGTSIVIYLSIGRAHV